MQISTLQMNNKIKQFWHRRSVEEGCVCIRIVQSSACSACKVAAHCTASESKEKMIEVSTSEASLYHKGDSVVVTADSAVASEPVSMAISCRWYWWWLLWSVYWKLLTQREPQRSRHWAFSFHTMWCSTYSETNLKTNWASLLNHRVRDVLL